jgi:hypothetical protein
VRVDLKFMQDLHNKEFATKESLAQRASTIIAGLTTLGGIVAFVIVNFKPVDPRLTVMFCLAALVAGIALGGAAGYLAWSYRVPPLDDLAKPTQWLSYWNGLRAQAAAGTVASAEAEFTDYLLTQYAEIGDRNIDANFTRGTRLVASNNLLLASLACVVLTSLVFYYNNYIAGGHAVEKGVRSMITSKDALVCLPAADLLTGSGDGRPGPRPVPLPAPAPDRKQ